jgi:hypothetical protein
MRVLVIVSVLLAGCAPSHLVTTSGDPDTEKCMEQRGYAMEKGLKWRSSLMGGDTYLRDLRECRATH